MSFDALMGNVSRDEMKTVLAGSGYTQSQGGGGGGYIGANAMSIGYQTVASFYPGMQSTNIPGSAMYVPQQSYNSSNGWGIVDAAVNQYNYNNNYSIATNNSSSNNLGWVATTNGNIKTTDPTAISRMMGLVDLNILNNRSPGYGLNDFVQNETTASGRAINDTIYGAIALNAVTVYNNYRSPQGMNYQNGQLYLDMGVMMGSGGVMMGSGGDYQVQTLSIANFNKIDPTPDFLASPFGTIYNKLTSQNNNFLCLLDKFNNSGTFNLTYLYSSIGMEKPNYDAQTSGSLIIKNKVVFGANLTQQFNPDKIFSVITSGNITKTYERSEIGKVSDIVHEALHAYMNINKIASGATHTAFNDYRNLMINTLNEYNIDNNLGFTATQINEMAFKGTMGSNTVAPSEQFSCYIEGLSNANKTTYSEELKAFNSRLASLNWSLISTTTN